MFWSIRITIFKPKEEERNGRTLAEELTNKKMLWKIKKQKDSRQIQMLNLCEEITEFLPPPFLNSLYSEGKPVQLQARGTQRVTGN